MPEQWSVADVAALRSNPAEFDTAATGLTTKLDQCDTAADAVHAVGQNGWDGFDGESAAAMGVLVQAAGIAMQALPDTARSMVSALTAASTALTALKTGSDQLFVDAEAQWPIFVAARQLRDNTEQQWRIETGALGGLSGDPLKDQLLVVADRLADRNAARTAYTAEKRALDRFQTEHGEMRDQEDTIHFDVAAAEMTIEFAAPLAAPGVNAVLESNGSVLPLLDDLIANGSAHPTDLQNIIDARNAISDFAGPTTGATTGTDAEIMADALAALVDAKNIADNGGPPTGPTATETGTTGDDTIVVTQLPDGRLRVTVNGVTYTLTDDESERFQIDSGDGDDTIIIDSGVTHDITVNSGDGDDTIRSGSGNDVIDSGDGSDTVNGGAGDDVVRAGSGSDSIEGGDGSDLIDGGSGADIILGGGLGGGSTSGGRPRGRTAPGDDHDRINGGGGDDTIGGGHGDDTIVAGSGDDGVNAGAGDDTVYGGNDDDTIHGNDGNDTIHGEDGSDKIYGDDGNDTIDGGRGNDYAEGNAGNDGIDGGSEDDTVYGGEGNDTVDGQDGEDNIHGGSGDDDLRGGDGNDIVSGNAGDDVLRGGEGDDVIATGSGDDQVVADGFGDNDTIYAENGDDVQAGPGDTVERIDVDIDLLGGDDPPFVIDGDSDFHERVEADLELLAQTPEGRELLENIMNSGHTVTIVPSPDGGSAAGTSLDASGDASGVHDDAKIDEKGDASDGHDVFVVYNPTGRLGDERTPNLIDTPPAVILAHELVHAEGAVTGTLDPTETDAVDINGNPTGARHNNWEPEATGLPYDPFTDADTDLVDDVVGVEPHPGGPSENSIRDDWGLDPREVY